MTSLIFDPFMGASGDMIIAALIDLGADQAHIKETMESAAPVTVKISRTMKNGIAATSVSVTPENSVTHTYPEILADIRASELPDHIIDDVTAVFNRMASAESTVHNVSKDQLHFHEIGQADAIADVVGASAAIHNLAPDAIFCRPIVTGTGYVKTAHGTLPVPAPATLEILCGSRLLWSYGDIKHELLTPTGAAILAHLTCSDPNIPNHNQDPDHNPTTPMNTVPGADCSATRAGYGAGKADLKIPNVLRAILCENKHNDAGLLRDNITVLETSVDDVTGEVLGSLIEELIAMGAHDAIMIPATMKKGRSGQLIQVITKSSDSARVARRIIEETGSLGVRITPTRHRLIANRRITPINIEIGGNTYAATIKIATDNSGDVLNISAEFDDAKRIARLTGVPVREVMRRIVDHAWKQES
ncbi:MAG: nickel pincer cofactor biosynthesis protein LarC [Methanosarcinales archaeon]|nr:MAG: nickel pincer cofactor biosynthesis protein LarC [Methanosarcinales archaeon]